MSSHFEILAYLVLEEQDPLRSGERLIDWAANCQVDGVILPQTAAAVARKLIQHAKNSKLSCHIALKPGDSKNDDADGYYIDSLEPWAALPGPSLVRVTNEKEAKRYQMAEGARLVYAHRERPLKTWLNLCQTLQKDGNRLPGYFDEENSNIDSALERAAYAPLLIKRLSLNRGLSGPISEGTLIPLEFGKLVRIARSMREQLAALDGMPFSGSKRRNDNFAGVPDVGIADISIVIRSKDEAEWIGKTLEAIAGQSRQPKEVILVDNQSSDETLAVARSFQGRLSLKVISISKEDFNFSRALNRGIKQTTAPWVVSLSAHCVPVNEHWLAAFEKEIFRDDAPRFAGVYGRQEPVEGVTSDFDKRDLWTTFGAERRVQINSDFFFHNANSMIRREFWEEVPFNESIHGVEDRDWAQRALRAGYAIVYAPGASVYHHHGIHHGRNEERAKRVVKVIELIQQRAPTELTAR